MENHMVLGSNGRYDYAGDNEPKEPEIYKCIFCDNTSLFNASQMNVFTGIQMYRCYFYFEGRKWHEDVCADCLDESEYIEVVKL